MRHHPTRAWLLRGVSLLLLFVATAGAVRLWGFSAAVRALGSDALSVEPPADFWVHDGTLAAVWIDGWRVAVETWTVGPFLTAMSPGPALLVADTRRPPAVRSWVIPLPPGTLSYAILRPVRIAVGTRQGTVQWQGFDPDRPADVSRMDAPGAVRALAFRDESSVVVGGDFRGLHLLTPERASQELVASVVGTRALATWGPRAVYLTDEGLMAATLGETSRLTTAGIIILVMGGLAVVGFITANLTRWRLAPRRGPESTTGPSTAPPTPVPEIRTEHRAVPTSPEKRVAARRRPQSRTADAAGPTAVTGAVRAGHGGFSSGTGAARCNGRGCSPTGPEDRHGETA